MPQLHQSYRSVLRTITASDELCKCNSKHNLPYSCNSTILITHNSYVCLGLPCFELQRNGL